MGSEVITRSGFISPNSRLSGVTSDNAITAGEYHAIGINAQGMSAEQLNPLPFAHPVATYSAGSVIVEWS